MTKAHHYGSLRTTDPGFNCGGGQLDGNLVLIILDVTGWELDLMR